MNPASASPTPPVDTEVPEDKITEVEPQTEQEPINDDLDISALIDMPQSRSGQALLSFYNFIPLSLLAGGLILLGSRL